MLNTFRIEHIFANAMIAHLQEASLESRVYTLEEVDCEVETIYILINEKSVLVVSAKNDADMNNTHVLIATYDSKNHLSIQSMAGQIINDLDLCFYNNGNKADKYPTHVALVEYLKQL